MRPSITRGGFLDAQATGNWHREIIRHLESLPREDPIRRSELMYHHVRTEDATAAARYYARIIDEWELDCATRTLAAELVSGESITSNSRLEWMLGVLCAPGINMALATSLCTRYLYYLLPALADGLSVRTRLAIVSAVRAQLLKILEKFPRMPHVERLLAVAHDRLGDLYRETENWESARGAFEDGLNVRDGLARGGFGDSDLRLDLSVSHSRLGDINDRLGDVAKAMDHYMRDVRLTTELHASDPSHADYLRNLWMSHAKLGDLRARVADRMGAEANYAIALTCAESWRAADPGDPERIHGVSVAQERLARLAAGSGDRERALALGRDCLSLRREVYRLDPSSIEHARDLAAMYDLLAELRDPDAIEYERYALEIVTGLLRRVPDNRELERDSVLMAKRLEILLEEEKEAGNV
jgi:tetratricopeptide (TPR) repeat protein